MGKKSQQVYDYLIQYIQENHLRPADQLPTEKQIGESLNVSRTTIQHAIRELVQNNIAYRIQGGGTYLSETQSAPSSISFIPLVISNQDKATGFYDYIAGAEAFLADHSCYLTVHCSHGDCELECQIIQRLIDDGAQCIMISATLNSSADFFLKHIQNGVHFVFLDYQPLAINADLVASDNIAGGIAACEYLIKLGHRRIQFITPQTELDNVNTVQDRLAGYRYAMRSHGLDRYCHHLLFDDNNPDLQKVLETALQTPEPPTALFASNDMVARMSILALQKIGLSTPKDISVIGFDGKMIASAFEPPITTVEQQFFNIGYQAAELAHQYITGAATTSVIHKYLPTHILEGKSIKSLL